MADITDYKLAKSIMGSNFIGIDELKSIKSMRFAFDKNIPDIFFSEGVLEQKKDNYILILGVSNFFNGDPVTIRNLRNLFGKNPEVSEPCFYNQDWYDKENFVDISMSDEWYLIRKNVYEESRAVQPQELMRKYLFPSAVSCTYAFFTAWLALGIRLWYHDFVWCSDTDHNGDGFSIHRHLALRPCYACID